MHSTVILGKEVKELRTANKCQKRKEIASLMLYHKGRSFTGLTRPISYPGERK
jgi:hypothetical protein